MAKNETALATILASDWLADSVATTHITQHKHDFISYVEELSIIEGITPGAVLWTHRRGEFKMHDKIYSVTLCDVKHTPNAPNNLISIGWLTDNGHSAIFTATGIKFKSSNDVIFAEGQKIG